MARRFENTFAVTEIYPDTYRIIDNAMGNVNLYLLVGSRRALLIDSGYGNPKLRDVIARITDKEVICALTHGHVDHALGAYLFEKAYLHESDAALYQCHTLPEMIRKCGYEGVGAKPKRELRMDGYRENIELLAAANRKPPRPLQEIDDFELGGRCVSWFHVPGHTPGSVVFLDEANHTVFDGDAAGNGVWLFMPESEDLSDFSKSLSSYAGYLRHHQVSARYGGHALDPLTAGDLSALQNLCAKTAAKQRDGKRPGIPVHFAVGKARMVLKGRTAMFIKP